MPAPVLRHYSQNVTAGGSNATIIGSAAGTSRALVISKVIITNQSATATTGGMIIYAGAEVLSTRIVDQLSLAPGESYVETGLVLLAGEFFRVFTPGAPVNVNIFGQEVDN